MDKPREFWGFNNYDDTSYIVCRDIDSTVFFAMWSSVADSLERIMLEHGYLPDADISCGGSGGGHNGYTNHGISGLNCTPHQCAVYFSSGSPIPYSYRTSDGEPLEFLNEWLMGLPEGLPARRVIRAAGRKTMQTKVIE